MAKGRGLTASVVARNNVRAALRHVEIIGKLNHGKVRKPNVCEEETGRGDSGV